MAKSFLASAPKAKTLLGVLAATAAIGGATIAGRSAQASYTPPWVDDGPPLDRWVRSVRILEADEPIRQRPDLNAPRRGSALMGARLPIYGARNGPGCKERFYHVGPSAWVCGDRVELSGNASIDASKQTWAHSFDGLPFRYHFVGPDGSFGYKKMLEADIGAPDFQMDPGFAVAVTEEQAIDGHAYGLTNNGLWVPMRDLTPVRTTSFKGSPVPANADPIPFAWVYAHETRVYRTASHAVPTTTKKKRFDRVPFLEESKGFSKMVRIGENAWVDAKDLRHPTIAEPPDEIDADGGERWVDVELATQTVVAYEGRVPVFATIVSTGKGRQGTANETPKGVHRVWVKLLSSDMDNLEDEHANRYWRMEDVPYVQYFSKGVGLHGAFWHRSFGRVRSHGCVNLAPLDAERLFWWTGPRLPAGWTAILPTDQQPGAVVRVR